MSTSKRSTSTNGDNDGSKQRGTSKISAKGSRASLSSHISQTPIKSSICPKGRIEDASPAAIPPSSASSEKCGDTNPSVDNNFDAKSKKGVSIMSGKRSRSYNDLVVSDQGQNESKEDRSSLSLSQKKKDKKRTDVDNDGNQQRISVTMPSPAPREVIRASTTKSEEKRNAKSNVTPSPTKRLKSTDCTGSISSQKFRQSQNVSISTLSLQPPVESTEGDSHSRSVALSSPVTSNKMDIISSKALSAYAIGVSCMALSNCQTKLVIAREDGSLQLFNVVSVPKRQTACLIPICTIGSPDAKRTISKVVFAMNDRVVLCAYLSGQVIVLNAQSLAPEAVMERSGGAVWDLAVVPFSEEEMILKASSSSSSHFNPNSGNMMKQTIFAAISDGSWHQLVLEEIPCSSVSSASFAVKYRLYLFQICPKIIGSNRAISVVVCSGHTNIPGKTIPSNSSAQSTAGTVIVGGDDLGNLVAWHYRGLDQRTPHAQLWTSRLPKGGYAKAMAYSSNTCTIAAGTSLGDVVLVRGGVTQNGGTILASFTHHRGPISALICTSTSKAISQSDISMGGNKAIDECFYATGWHESLRCYRYQQEEERWHPAEVKRRTHYHEATCLAYLPCAGTVLSGARDGTVMVVAAGSNQRISTPKGAKYINITQQAYAFAPNVGLIATICGTVVEIYKSNENMNHWAPFASYTVNGEQTLTGLWCDDDMSVLCVSSALRTSVIRIKLIGRASISMEKLVDIELFGVKSVIINETTNEDNVGDVSAATERHHEIYILSSSGVTHISAPKMRLESRTEHRSVGPIISTIQIPDEVEGKKVCFDSMGVIDQLGSLSLIIASSSATANGTIFQMPVNKDGSLNVSIESGAYVGWTIVQHAKGNRILSCGAGRNRILGLVQRQHSFIDICPTNHKSVAVSLPATLPPDTVFIARIERSFSSDSEESTSNHKKRRVESNGCSDGTYTLWMGYCPKGLLFSTHRSWWLVDKSHQATSSKAQGNANDISASPSFALEPRTTFVSGFQLSDTAVLVLERDIEAEVESLPLMWKVRRFAN